MCLNYKIIAYNANPNLPEMGFSMFFPSIVDNFTVFAKIFYFNEE